MKLIINGEARQFDTGMNVQQLVTALELDVRKIAIERNLEIVPRGKFTETALKEGDEVEIVHFIGGG